jgi:hypothetical protein
LLVLARTKKAHQRKAGGLGNLERAAISRGSLDQISNC